ncbi:MmcQ/YjbR family DNA-binding protein [Nonomuraea sp. NPDC003214]
MSTEDDVRRLATALPEVTERISYGTPAFYVAGKIFARVHEEPGVLVCWRASLDEREALVQADPDTFFTTDHYAGHASVLVRLDRVDAEELSELLAEAWEARAPRRLRKPAG